MKIIVLTLFLAISFCLHAQVGINSDGSNPDPSAGLDVNFSSKGFLPPRMTKTQLYAIDAPADGLIVYCSDCGNGGTGSLVIFMNEAWHFLTSGCMNPSAPVSGLHTATQTKIVWRWNKVTGAIGYKWHNTDDYATAIDMETDTSMTETGLVTGTGFTTYVRYVWAYNACGISTSVTLTSQTIPCGNPFTITHTASIIAPVTKTVTYGTTTNIPGEISRCWITSNLGASNQATAVNDATEASAGWYWQFNRKQGYKHDGTTRTPNTTWVSSINENSNWLAANDPCSIELGPDWRLPTSTEWSNVNSSGGWFNWNGPWFSNLKMHAAGGLNLSNGSLIDRGTSGTYLSSNQTSPTTGRNLNFTGSNSQINTPDKAFGFSVRCLNNIVIPTLPSVTTVSASGITSTSASSGGNVTSDNGLPVTAKGVCWSTSQNPTLADDFTVNGTGTGSFTSSLTGLSANTVYYVRAYATNSAGTAYGNEVSFTTLWACGAAISVNHVAGVIAPETKSTSYGTTTNVPGEPSKCWITKNLGASYGAPAVSSNQESTAGWYWQFNHKQGYKHDGTTRIPNTAWNSTISENSNWQAINDPCTIELGSPWRIPTPTEWSNVDAGGGWTNWNGPWYSSLKLHAAGLLSSSNGSLGERGLSGYYWSSGQSNTTSGTNLFFNITFSAIDNSNKAASYPLRCIRD